MRVDDGGVDGAEIDTDVEDIFVAFVVVIVCWVYYQDGV